MSTALVEAVRGAVFLAIEAAQVATGAAVLDHVPQDQQPSFVVIDDIDWTNEGGKGDPSLKITIDVVSIYRGEDRAELLAIMHANELALVDVVLTADDVSIEPASLIGGSASGAGPDGLTYAGIQSFEIYAEPA